MRRAKVGVVQITSGPEVEPNLQATERTVRGAAADGAELVVVPECFAYLGPEGGQRDVAEALPEGGPILERCRALARDTGVELVLGGFWERVEGRPKVRNACVHLSADGSVAAVYRKIHLFDVDLPDGTVLAESDTVEPGTEPVVTEAPFGPLGLSVCYDLRFPELYRRLVDGGAIALAVPAAFTLTTGKDHWHVLLRARAIEQQCYVLAAAQTGHHFGKRVSYGHALVADPWGTVVAECSDGEGWAVATVDPERVHRVRAALPSLRHRVAGESG
jgi:deaminated glutathione amidase